MKKRAWTALLPLLLALCLLFAGCDKDASLEATGTIPQVGDNVGSIETTAPETAPPTTTQPVITTAPTETDPPVTDPGRLGCLTPSPASCVESWLGSRNVALSSEGGKGVGTYNAFVDSHGNVILEGSEETIWATEDGYARVIFCEPGTTEPISDWDLYDYFDAVEYGGGSDAVYDAYVERYDREGNFLSRELLAGDGYWDRLNQGRNICPPAGGLGETYVDCYSFCMGDTTGYDAVNCQAADGGYMIYDDDGSYLGTIPCDPANHTLLAKDNMIFVIEEQGDYRFTSDVYYINE